MIVHCWGGRNNCFFLFSSLPFFFNEAGSRDDVGPSCSRKGSPTGQMQCVQAFLPAFCRVPVGGPSGSLRLRPQTPKRGLDLFWCLVPTGFSGVPNALRIVADQTKATAECGAAMWMAGDKAW